MTKDEKFKMFQRKAAFISRLKEALTNPPPFGSNLTDLRYEVYEGPAASDPSIIYNEEFIILVFPGAECPICSNGNSDSANLRIVANHLHGGMYDDVRFYEQIKSKMTQIL